MRLCSINVLSFWSSYFGSAIDDLFRAALQNKIHNKELGKLENEEIKLTVGQLVYDRNMVDLFILKKDISFQDMQSIARAFKDYIGVDEIPRDKIVNNINCLEPRPCRHGIVHDGSTANKRVIDQIKSANPRELKPNLKVEEKILFTEDEIKIITTSMTRYIDRPIRDN